MLHDDQEHGIGGDPSVNPWFIDSLASLCALVVLVVLIAMLLGA